MVARACNLSIHETEAGEPYVQVHCELHRANLSSMKALISKTKPNKQKEGDEDGIEMGAGKERKKFVAPSDSAVDPPRCHKP